MILKEVNLNSFKGIWCQVTERVEFGENGKYFLKIETVAGREILFEYENTNIPSSIEIKLKRKR